MRICACPLGRGLQPGYSRLLQSTPGRRPDIPDFLTGAQIARAYAEFFEPDVFVEAEPSRHCGGSSMERGVCGLLARGEEAVGVEVAGRHCPTLVAIGL